MVVHGLSSIENVYALFMCRLKSDIHFYLLVSRCDTQSCLHCSILLVTNMK